MHKHAPVLTDVDIVYLVCHDSQFGDGLDHVITLQHQVTLEVKGQKVKDADVTQAQYSTVVHFSHLLLTVSSGNVQNKEAVAEGTNRDACKVKQNNRICSLILLRIKRVRYRGRVWLPHNSARCSKRLLNINEQYIIKLQWGWAVLQ